MQTCQNCGDTRQEKFCPNCGEKKFHTKALSIKHLAEETFESLSHFDNKFFKSIATLLIRPGVLSYEFCKGVTVRFMKPFALFLVVNYRWPAGFQNVVILPGLKQDRVNNY